MRGAESVGDTPVADAASESVAAALAEKDADEQADSDGVGEPRSDTDADCVPEPDAQLLARRLAEPLDEPPTREREAAPDAEPVGVVDLDIEFFGLRETVGDVDDDLVITLALDVLVARAESEKVSVGDCEEEWVTVAVKEPLDEEVDDSDAPLERVSDGEPLAEPLSDGEAAAEGDDLTETERVRVCVLVKGVTVPVNSVDTVCVIVAGRKRVMVA